MSRSTRIPTSCKFTAPKERTAPLTGFPGRGAFFRIQVVFLLYKGGEGPLPSFRFAKCHCPFLSPGGDIFPRPGEVFPLRWRLWQRRKVYRLSADFFLPLTNEDETCPLCQGLALRKTSPGRGKMSPIGDKKGNELSSAARLRGFVPEPAVQRSETEMAPPNTKTGPCRYAQAV